MRKFLSQAKARLAAATVVAMCLVSSAGFAQTAPVLGQAGNFAVLGGSAVSNTGATIVTGDLGIWPNTASSITGFPPGSVVGTVHAGDAVAQQAQADLTTAYNDAAGRPCGTVLTGSDLGGQTLTPGVYCFANSAQLTGTLTLDALGNPDAVFIIQVGSTLTTASNASVVVMNGGSGCNVFWQVGSSATLGTGTALQGNILALTSITATTGSSVTGRVLARNGAVTLDTNSVGSCIAGACPVLDLSPLTLPQGVLGAAYTATVTASGGTAPYAYSVSSGSLPTGLLLNAATGALSGTPLALGNFTFTITAIDSEGCQRSRSYTIVISAAMCPALVVTPPTLSPVAVGQPYSQQLTASGGVAPYTYSLTAGALPLGVLLDSASGLLAGTPTTPGSFSFSVTARDANGCVGERAYTLLVSPAACPTLGLLPLNLPVMVVGIPYSQTFSGSGGSAPYTYALTAGALPPGLSLNPQTGRLSGVPATAGIFSFTITVTDALGCVTSVNFTAQVAVTAAPVGIPLLSPWMLALLGAICGLVGLIAFRPSR